jgi:hypothetical protein
VADVALKSEPWSHADFRGFFAVPWAANVSSAAHQELRHFDERLHTCSALPLLLSKFARSASAAAAPAAAGSKGWQKQSSVLTLGFFKALGTGNA